MENVCIIEDVSVMSEYPQIECIVAIARITKLKPD